MAKKLQSGAEVAKELMDKMRHKEPVETLPPEAPEPGDAQADDGPTLEERMDAAFGEGGVGLFAGSHPLTAAAPAPVAAAAAPQRVRMSGTALKAMLRQDRREKRLKERGY